MRGLVFNSRADAEVVRADADRIHGLPKVHIEGTEPGAYAIPNAGRAAARIRAHGVHTEHQFPVLEHLTESRFAIPFDDSRAIDLDENWGSRRLPRTE